MKHIQIAALIVCALFWARCGNAVQPSGHNDDVVQPSGHNGVAAGDDGPIGRAFKTRTSNVRVEGEGVVTRILTDDLTGDRHQRFIIRLSSGQTLLITHNIDIAPRIDGLSEGDSVRFKGEYMWNEQGGVIHWTHHDPAGRHAAGWLKHKGHTYQ